MAQLNKIKFGLANQWPSQILAAGPVLGFSPTLIKIDGNGTLKK